MKRITVPLVLLFVVVVVVPAMSSERLTSPDGKKMAEVLNGSVTVGVSGEKSRRLLIKINPSLDNCFFIKWSPKSNLLVYKIRRVYPEESGARGDDCENQVCAYKDFLYAYNLDTRKVILLAKPDQYLNSGSFGGVVAFGIRGTGSTREVCWEQDGCSLVTFTANSFSYAQNIYYFVPEGEADKYIKQVNNGIDFGDRLYKSIIITRDYNGKLIKKSAQFYVHDPACCMPSD